MNQADLISAVAKKTGLTKADVDAVLASTAEAALASLKGGVEVTLPGLGKLKTVARAARKARNPKTGEAVNVPARTVVKFSPAMVLRESMPKPKK